MANFSILFLSFLVLSQSKTQDSLCTVCSYVAGGAELYVKIGQLNETQVVAAINQDCEILSVPMNILVINLMKSLTKICSAKDLQKHTSIQLLTKYMTELILTLFAHN
jgi:hypothetical protein